MPQPAGDARQRVISREVHFVEIDSDDHISVAGSAPYLDYRSAAPDEIAQIEADLQQPWLEGSRLQDVALEYAVEHLVRSHQQRVQERRLSHIEKTLVAVNRRLTREINYWDERANTLYDQEQAGKKNARINSQKSA